MPSLLYFSSGFCCISYLIEVLLSLSLSVFFPPSFIRIDYLKNKANRIALSLSLGDMELLLFLLNLFWSLLLWELSILRIHLKKSTLFCMPCIFCMNLNEKLLGIIRIVSGLEVIDSCLGTFISSCIILLSGKTSDKRVAKGYGSVLDSLLLCFILFALGSLSFWVQFFSIIHYRVLSMSGKSCIASSKMVGSVDVLAADSSINGAAERLPEDFNPTALIKDLVPPLIGENGIVKCEAQNSTEKGERKIVLGRNMHAVCLEVTEPDTDDEVTGEREAYMASVLARYKRSLTEKTKYHLGLKFDTITVALN